MTEERHVLAPARPASRAKRIVEWFWRRGALAEKKSTLPSPSARAALLGQRAHGSAGLALSTAELARNVDALGSASAEEGQVEVNACELYRQSAYWSLCALAAQADEQAGTSYSEAIWDTLDEQLLTGAASGVRAEVLRTSLRNGSFVYFTELPASEQAAILPELRKLAESLILKVDERKRAIQGVLLQRAWRMSLLLFMLLLLGAGLVWERRTREERSDLTRGASWRASSKLEGPGCASPEQQCAESASFFFHTKEDKEPWLEFDLGKERQVAAVQIDNRVDCCFDRIIPLVVEVSDNHKNWRTVARQDADFKNWRATFAPLKTRWVRLRVDRRSFLHLSRVRIYPPQ